jgi:hypothetical protein
MVCWTTQEKQIQRRFRTQAEKKMWALGMGTDSPQRTKEVWANELQVMVTTVWVDTIKAPEFDNWEARTGKKDGVLSGGRIPSKLKAEYETARKAIRQYLADRDKPVEGPKYLLDEATFDAVKEMREREVPWVFIANALKLDAVLVRKEYEERTKEVEPKVRKPRKVKEPATEVPDGMAHDADQG